MNELLKYANNKKILNSDNEIIRRSLDTFEQEDKIIKILTKEVSEFAMKLLKFKNNSVSSKNNINKESK